MTRRWQIMVLGPLVAGVFALPAAAQQPQPPLGVTPGQAAPGGQQGQPATPQPRINPGEPGFVPPPPSHSREPGPSLGSPPHIPEGVAPGSSPSNRESSGSLGPTTPSSSVPLTPGASGGLGGQASGGMGGMGAGPTGGGAPGAGGGGR
jgi:translation initiation factor IF-2